MTPVPEWSAHLPPGTSPREPDLLAGESLPGSWRRHWLAAPRRRVLHHPDTGWCTAGELEERSRRVAGRLAGAGLRAGDRLLCSAAPSRDLVVAHVAALRLGLVVVPVNGAYRQPEVAHIAADARPAGAVVDDAERAGWVREAAPGDPVVVSPAVELAEADPPPLDAVTRHAPALLVYTSGTTGAPKGALLRHGNLLAGAHAVRLAWRWQPDDRLLLTLPLFHLHGLGVGLHGTLTAGASVLLRPGFDVGDVADQAPGATLFFGVPTLYARLAAAERLAALGRLRLCVSGSAPLPAQLWATVARRGGQQILERYGMTETMMLASNPYAGERRPGTVGRALPGVELRLAEDGEVLARGPNVFGGYWERPDADADAFDADGWFATGDLGHRDEADYLRLVGRKKELIITGGENVHPREVEDELRRHPGVADVAVVGLPSDRWGEEVAAFVEAVGALDEAGLRALAADRLAPHKRPRHYARVDALPRNALGKVTKRQLRRAPEA